MARNKKRYDQERVAVIGLGRFGASLANELITEGADVLGIDSDATLVQRYSDMLTHSAIADSTDPQAVKQLGLADFERIVVCIGSDLEASILTTSVLAELGVPDIWAKATSRQHGAILERVGAHHVVLPEHEMGERVAHLVTGGKMLDYVEFEQDYAMVKAHAPREIIGARLETSGVRRKYGVTIVAVKHPNDTFSYAGLDTVIEEGDVLIVAGRTHAVERFAARH